MPIFEYQAAFLTKLAQGVIEPDAEPVALIIRHGQTELNRTNKFRGKMDVPLDEEGKHQAFSIIDFVAKYPIIAIKSSPMVRTLQMAAPLAKKLGLTVEPCEELLPWDVGILSGKDREQYEYVLRHFIDNPDKEIPDGEKLDHFEDRTKTFFEKELKHSTPKGMKAFFCHTSNLVALSNLIAGTRHTKPEIGEVVRAGGVCALFHSQDGYAMEPVFGHVKPAEFGG